MGEDYNPPRGTRDIYGDLAEIYRYLFEVFAETASRNGFKLIITPTIEYFKLFEAKSGEEIKNSMYVFEDKAGRKLALRPEVTASVIRAFLRHMRAEPRPLRLYYISQCFRYEEPQYARYREFWQAGLEVIGEPDVNADIAVAFTASSFLEKMGVKHYYVYGNVAIYRALMNGLGIPHEAQDHILHLIDKDRASEALREVESLVGERGVEIFETVMTSTPDKLEPLLGDLRDILGDSYEKVVAEQRRVVEFADTLKELGYVATYDPKLVRGLAYYTGLIFEYKTEKMGVSIGGGGRYDGLTTVYGGPYEYSTGLALGVDRIALTLQNLGVTPAVPESHIVIVLGNTPLHIGYKVAKRIESEGKTVVVYKASSLSKALEYADKKEFTKAWIIGEKELRSGKAVLKNLKTWEQEEVDLSSYL